MKPLFILQIIISLSMLLSCNSNKTETSKEATMAYKAEAITGEGSIWNPLRNSLFWVDIEGKTLYEFHPETSQCDSWKLDKMVTTVVPETDSTVVVALQDEIARINLNSGAVDSIRAIPVDGGKLRTNDGKCDPSGRLWIGTMGFGAPKDAGTLYCVSPDGKLEVKLNPVTISNGIVWSKDAQYMFYNDTPTNQVARFLYNNEENSIIPNGVAAIMNKDTGSPDGMTIDENDNIWVAQWGGFGVYCYNPHNGNLLEKIDVPAPHVASCAFGGKDLDTLYITTARAGLSSEDLQKYPLSGSLFKYVPGEKGVKAVSFGLTE